MARRSRKRAGKEHLDGSPNHQGAQEQPTAVNAEKPQLLYPETELTLSKDPEIKMVEEREVKKVEGEERNEPNQLRNEPDSTPAKETIIKSVNDLDSEHHDLCPKLDPLSPQKTNPVLLPGNETNGLSAEPDSTTSRKKRKRKGKSLSSSEGTKTNNVHFEHRELIPNLDPFSRKDLDPVLLPEPEPVVVKNETNGLSPEPDSTTSRKKNEKCLSSSEGTEANNVHFEHHELAPNVDPLSPKNSDSVLLPEPEPVAEKNETNQLCTEPESATPRKKRRKRKGKSLSTSEVTETSNVHLEHRELVTNLDPLFPKGSDPILLPEPEPVAEKNETNQLCTEQESATGRKKKRKRKGKSISTSEVIETSDLHFEHRELIPNLDPLPPKDSVSSLLLEPEPVAEKTETNQLCTEQDPVNPRKKKKRKKKGKSMSTSEGVEVNHVDSEHCVPCPNLAALPPKDQDPLLLREPGLVGEKNEANQLCTKPDSTSPKFEGAVIKDMDYQNLKLCPELDPLTLKHSDPLLLPESEPAKEVEQKKKRKKKKKKNKGDLEGDGAVTNRPSNEHSQKCHKAKPKTLEEQNQMKRKRQAMNDDWSMVTPNYNTGLRRATMLNSEAVGCGPWIPKGPLKDYECYERCLECRQLCQSGQTCRRKLPKNSPTCFFCGAIGHLLRTCPLSPGAKCANGIIMLDGFVRKKCWRKSERTEQQVAPANVPTLPCTDLYAY